MKSLQYVTAFLLASFVIIGCKKNILLTEKNNKTIKPVCFSDSLPEMRVAKDSLLLYKNVEEINRLISTRK